MYKHSTAYYDLIYRELKDYRDEAAKIHALLQKLPSAPQHLLDVGCGTGEHARILANQYGYSVDGIDLQPGFIDIATRKLPESSFTVADMRDFALGKEYDAILCLFSSIGYTETPAGLSAALDCIAKHLKPGGWLICEPWITPDLWVEGQQDVVTTTDPKTKDTIIRTRNGRSDGRVSVLEIEYVIKGATGNHRFSETHRLGMFEKDEIEVALDKLGLTAIWLPTGLQLQSLFLATKRENVSSGQK